MTLSEAEEARRLAAYHSNSTDRLAALALGVSKKTFTNWRTSRSLFGKGTMAISSAEHERRMLAYEQANNDHDAASELGIHADTFKAWRQDNGLAPRGTRSLEDDLENRRRIAYDAGSSDWEAAATLGIGEETFKSWRQSRSLPAKGWTGKPLNPLRVGFKSTDPTIIAKAIAIASADGNSEASRRMNVHPESVAQWRREFTMGHGRTKLLLTVGRVLRHAQRTATEEKELQRLIAEVAHINKRLDAQHAATEKRNRLRGRNI